MDNKTAFDYRPTTRNQWLEHEIWGRMFANIRLGDRGEFMDEALDYSQIASKIEIKYGWQHWCDLLTVVLDEVLQEKE